MTTKENKKSFKEINFHREYDLRANVCVTWRPALPLLLDPTSDSDDTSGKITS